MNQARSALASQPDSVSSGSRRAAPVRRPTQIASTAALV
jgi:hypothetical protein